MNKEKLSLEHAWSILGTIVDPEIPVLSLQDLGIIRDVSFEQDILLIKITPTYSGCPAREVISQTITNDLSAHGYKVEILEQLSPAWTTEWMSESGKHKLKEYGIAPPHCIASKLAKENERPDCPQCSSHNTELLSAFGSTACKSLYRCLDCLEPFDYFKPI